MTAEQLIRLLELTPHPEEGGFFRETYRCNESIDSATLPKRYAGNRVFGTAIYFLLTPMTFSAMHRLESDEIFHFYLGDPIEMLHLLPDGTGQVKRMGTAFAADMAPQVIVPRGWWQGARLCDGGEFALLGTTVAPGFEFCDYQHGRRDELIGAFPQFSEQIRRLTPEA